MTAGTIIREARARYELSQEEFAGILGYERSTISNMEHGRRMVPDELLSQITKKFEDDMTAMQICSSCKQGGFFSGIEIPVELDGHFTEILCLSQLEFQEYVDAYSKYLDTARNGNHEQEKKAAEELSKQAYDLIPLILNLSLGLNNKYGIYHKNIWCKVKCSIKTLVNLKKGKESLRYGW